MDGDDPVVKGELAFVLGDQLLQLLLLRSLSGGPTLELDLYDLPETLVL